MEVNSLTNKVLGNWFHHLVAWVLKYCCLAVKLRLWMYAKVEGWCMLWLWTGPNMIGGSRGNSIESNPKTCPPKITYHLLVNLS